MKHASHQAWNKGLTKETSESVNRGANALKRKKSNIELELDDDGKLIRHWRNKCVNAKKEGLECKLTFDEYCQLVKKAGLKSSQLGFTGDGYVLGRYNDEGDYTIENCRFITQKENNDEKNERIKKIRGENPNNICTCGNWKDSSAEMCLECFLKHKSEYVSGTNIKKPTKNELQELLKTNSREKIGRMFGVTGNAVKKWVKKYKIN